MTQVRIVGTSHTGITVSDIRKSMAFYRDVLGFEVSEIFDCHGELFEGITGIDGVHMEIAYAEAPGHTIELLKYVSPGDCAPSTLRTCHPGHMHLALMVEDIEAVADAAKAGGFEPMSPVIPTVKDGERKGWRAIYLRDPDGVVIELMEEPESAQA